MKPVTQFNNITAVVTGNSAISIINAETGQPTYTTVTRYSGKAHFWQDSQNQQFKNDRKQSSANYTVKIKRSSFITTPSLSDIVTISGSVYNVYSIKGYTELWESVYLGVYIGN